MSFPFETETEVCRTQDSISPRTGSTTTVVTLHSLFVYPVLSRLPFCYVVFEKISFILHLLISRPSLFVYDSATYHSLKESPNSAFFHHTN